MLAATRYDHGNPTAYEQLMLELVNRARANPGAEAARLGIDLNEGLAPGTIQDTPKQPLAFHPLLIAAARAHSQWMLDNDIFSHTGEGGTTPKDRMGSAGYVFSGAWALGENIAWRGTTGPFDVGQYTVALHDALFRSAGHRNNLCTAGFDEVGLGVVQGVFTTTESYNALMATQDFAKSGSTPGPLLTGVVFADADGDRFYDPGEGVPGIAVAPEQGDFFAVTSPSGGYALPYPAGAGPVGVTFSGSPLVAPVSRTVHRAGENAKLDLDLATVRAAAFLGGTLRYSSGLGHQFDVVGTPGMEFHLEYSTDLVTWATLQPYTLATGPLPISHAPADPSGAHFYRLRWTE